MHSKRPSDLKYYIHEWLPQREKQIREDLDFPADGEYSHLVFAIHGLGGHAAWFEGLANNFKAADIPFYSYDLKGFGKSGYQKGHIDSYREWINDNQIIYNALKAKYPKAKITIFGHSLGASLATNMPQIFPGDNLILSVPGFRGARDKWDFWGFTVPTVLKLIFAPKTYVDLPEPEHSNPSHSDPLRIATTTAKLLGEILALNKSTKEQVTKLETPLLVIKSREDDVICNKTIDAYFAKIPSNDKKLYTIDTIHHDWIWYEVDNVSKDIIDWIKSK